MQIINENNRKSIQVMERSSTIIDTWKLCTFGSLVGCLILLLFLNQTDQNVSFSAARNMTILQLAPFGVLEPPASMIVESSEPSNFTDNTIEKPKILKASTSRLVEPRKSYNVTTKAVQKSSTTLDHTETWTPAHKERLNFTLNHIEKPTNKTVRKCNIFDGRWVYKPEGNSIYDTTKCSFLEEKMSCRKNGRPDFQYEMWQWEAYDCDIPLFNGTDMLERLRNKRVVIVGDSLNRNMWESLACLLYSSIPSSRAEVQAKSPAYKVFKAKDYNCVVEFYWSPFLIELNEHYKNGSKVLVLDKLSPSSKQWRGADVMVFNSGHWWIHLGKFRSWDMVQYKGKLTEEMPIELAYERGMRTWAKWIKDNVDPKKTTVFFRSISPEHKREQWCYNSTQPIMDESYKSLFPKSLTDIIEGLVEGMSNLHVKYLNITKLSSYRRDAHPSVYRSWKWKIYTTKYKRFLQSYADCSHWCLPGLPDTWNRLLYSSLFYHTTGDKSSS